MSEFDIVLSINDMKALKKRYVYILKDEGEIVYIGVCTFGVSFIHAHRSKVFDSAYIVSVPDNISPEKYKDELINKYKPKYNLEAEYVKKPKIELIKSDDMISLGKVRDILNQCNLQDYYINKSQIYPHYIEYPFIRRHKLHTTKYGSRSYVSLSDFRSVMLQEHDIDISKYID